jgi:uncharacterized protein (DUF1800 family)
MRAVLPLFLVLAVAPLAGQEAPARRTVHAGNIPHAKAGTSRGISSESPHLAPLTQRQRAIQILNRFTFGPRPGDLNQVLAIGVDKWFERQLNPDSISDDALERRLTDYPTLGMTPEQALTTFPNRATIQAVADEKIQPPSDPALAAMYDVQLVKLQNQQKAGANPTSTPAKDLQPTSSFDQDRATAARIAGQLFALPRSQRMDALIKLSVADRIAFTSFVSGDQKTLLLSQFTPRERELFLAMASNANSSQQIVSELSQAKILRAILSERQLQEVMTDFWFNHFNIFIQKNADQWYTTSYERDVIRKNALGKFRDLLLATATSPAMMVYLDNWQSVGPDSIANGVNPARPRARKGNRGLNENYGRELMELHTLGVDGGYTQADVTALSAILTGWTVDRPFQGGPFAFEARRHEPGPKQWLGHIIGDSTSQPADGMNEGLQALSILAANPATAHFISYKLAQRFVADDPPPALVDRMAATWLSSDGDIKAILRTLVSSPEFNSKKYFRNKVKTPFEFVASVFRTTATDPVNPAALVQTLRQMGMPPYHALPPTGYYITADHWMNSSALIDRLRFADVLTKNKFANQKFDAEHLLAIGLMASPPEVATAAVSRAERSGYRDVALSHTSAQQSSPKAGSELALHLLESALVGSDVSQKTNSLIEGQVSSLGSTSPAETLDLLTALILGSPEFQMR